MNKFRDIAKLINYFVKNIFLIIIPILKVFITIIPLLLRELYKEINKRLQFSITFKTTVTYTMIFSIILITLGTLLTSAFGFFLIYESNKSLTKNSLVITDLLIESTSLPKDKLKKYADTEVVGVTLFDQHMMPIYTTSENDQFKNTSHRTRLSSTSFVDQYLDYLYFETPVNLNNGISKIEVSKNLSNDKYYLALLTTATAISFLLAIILTSFIGSMASRKMLKPIDNMTRTAKSISAGDLNTRLDVVDSHDELKELALTFNDMLDRIQTSFDQQNVFVSDASHELRTPIAVIQGYANLLNRWGKEDKEVLLESINAIVSESKYMQELVEKLLFLASADKKSQILVTNSFSLNELIDEVLKETSIIDSLHIIGSEINETIMVNGDRGLIKQALRIFVDNSIKYTPAGGSININSNLRANKALMIIQDTGIGISAEDLPYIFNRFYKADKSRTRESGGAGAGLGLGLSIAKWIIEQHQGDIKVESIQNKGTKIIISLPAMSKNIGTGKKLI
jgi:signal transduction histidine kinase